MRCTECWISSLVLVALTTVGAAADDPIFSGPQVGEALPSLMQVA